MNTLIQVRVIAIGLCVAALAACASTKMQSEWNDASYTNKLVGQKVMVIAATKRTDLRRTFEDQLVRSMRDKGVNALPSYPYLTGNEPVSREALKEALQRNGVTAVLITRLNNVAQTGQVIDPQQAMLSGYYSAALTPEDTYAYTTYTTDVRLFDVASEKAVWAGTLQTANPNDMKSDVNKIAEGYSKKVVAALSGKKLI